MKKQFNRVKQLANQTVGRAGKTEVLSEDLLQIERRLETVRLVSHNVHKRIITSLQGTQGLDADKRHKKLPLSGLSQSMTEGGAQLGEESLIGKMLEVCGEAESKLAWEQSHHEVQLERDVLDPLNTLAEVEIPNILKQRKHLAKLVLDYDSAKARHHQAVKAAPTSTNVPAMTAKVNTLREEVVEAQIRMETCKDQLAADIYSFASREGEYARYYVLLLEAQAQYHRRALASLESVLPAVLCQQEKWTEKPAFGTALEEHLKRSGRDVALPLEACVMMLLETGLQEEGLFRIAAGASKLKKLKAALDCSTSQLQEFYSDPHAVAGALKSYLRELPEPLMTFQLYDQWIQASTNSDPDTRLQALWLVCDRLPRPNKTNFRYLVKFLARLAQDSEVNKMTASNIAIVLGPNLLWPKSEGSLAEMATTTSVHVVSILELVIQHAHWFFTEEVEFNVSGMFSTPDSEGGSIDRSRPGSQGSLEGSSSITRRATAQKKQHASPSSEGLEAGLLTTPLSDPPLEIREPPSPAQLSVGSPSSGPRGPSPFLVRRGTKKQAPAPPTVAPPPVTAPRRSTQTIQAPSHPPPPRPPPHSSEEPHPSPPRTPSPARTPLQPRPTPRTRPSVPPPAQPTPGGANGVCVSGSRIISDEAEEAWPEPDLDPGDDPPTSTDEDDDLQSETTSL